MKYLLMIVSIITIFSFCGESAPDGNLTVPSDAEPKLIYQDGTFLSQTGRHELAPYIHNGVLYFITAATDGSSNRTLWKTEINPDGTLKKPALELSSKINSPNGAVANYIPFTMANGETGMVFTRFEAFTDPTHGTTEYDMQTYLAVPRSGRPTANLDSNRDYTFVDTTGFIGVTVVQLPSDGIPIGFKVSETSGNTTTYQMYEIGPAGDGSNFLSIYKGTLFKRETNTENVTRAGYTEIVKNLIPWQMEQEMTPQTLQSLLTAISGSVIYPSVLTGGREGFIFSKKGEGEFDDGKPHLHLLDFEDGSIDLLMKYHWRDMPDITPFVHDNGMVFFSSIRDGATDYDLYRYKDMRLQVFDFEGGIINFVQKQLRDIFGVTLNLSDVSPVGGNDIGCIRLILGNVSVPAIGVMMDVHGADGTFKHEFFYSDYLTANNSTLTIGGVNNPLCIGWDNWYSIDTTDVIYVYIWDPNDPMNFVEYETPITEVFANAGQPL